MNKLLRTACLHYFRHKTMERFNEQEGREWNNGLFGCLGDFRICLISFIVPCYAEGKNAEAVGEDCLLIGVLALLGINFGPLIRWRLRQAKGIKGSMIMDMLYWMCCPCCALAQEAQEIGWEPPFGGGKGGSGGNAEGAKPEDMTRQ